jgi:hypothetical protein
MASFITISLGNISYPQTKVAISVPELVSQTNSFSIKRRPGCTPSLLDSNPKQLFLRYNVKCRESYSDPAGHDVTVKFDVDKVEDTQNANDLDVKLNCSCPAHLYWGAQWNLHQRDALLGEPRPELTAPTKRLDLRKNFVLCVAPGTRVLMGDGTEKLIENVQVGDWVVTHKGRARKVTHVSGRPAHVGEIAREVRAKGASEPLIVSKEHPLAVVRGNETCFCGCKGSLPLGYRGVKWGRKFLPGHHRNRPSRKLSEEAIAEIHSSIENQYTLAERYGVSQGTISRVQNRVAHVGDPEIEDCSQGKLGWVESDKLEFHEYLFFPKIQWDGGTEVDSNFASLLGYYLAEGSPIYRKGIPNKVKSGRPTTKGVVCDINGVTSRVWGVNFTINQDEAETLGQDIQSKLFGVLGAEADIQIKFRNYGGKKWLNVIVNDGKFAAKMIQLAGCGSLTKRLAPDVFKWNTEAIQALVSSYALGDGHFDASGQQYVYSISPHVVSQISTMLYSMGIWHGRLHQDWRGKKEGVRKKNRYFRLYWNYKQYPQLLDLMRGRLRTHVIDQLNTGLPNQETDVWQDGFTRVLHSANDVDAPEYFHDLTVDEDESFIANGVVVHNCKHEKAVLERILPSVQHNIQNIIRENTVKRNKDKQQPTEKSEKLKKEQDAMKKRQEIKKLREKKNKSIQQKLIDALREQEEGKKAPEEEEVPGVVERNENATEPLVVDTPKTEDVSKEEPEGEDDLNAMVENEEHKLEQQEHDKIKKEPHLHKGLPYETEAEKAEHGHNVPTDDDLLSTMRKTKEQVEQKMKKRKQTSLEMKLLSMLVGDDDV